MANYAYVENNEIQKTVGSLPTAWKNISGLHLLSNDIQTLISMGWYPIENIIIDFDASISYIDGYSYEILQDRVTKTPIILNYTPEQIENQKSKFFLKVRRLRDNKLKECDWTMMPDVTENQTAEWVNSWKLYRQELRDMPQTLTDTTDYNIDNVIWPIAPGV